MILRGLERIHVTGTVRADNVSSIFHHFTITAQQELKMKVGQ